MCQIGALNYLNAYASANTSCLCSFGSDQKFSINQYETGLVLSLLKILCFCIGILNNQSGYCIYELPLEEKRQSQQRINQRKITFIFILRLYVLSHALLAKSTSIRLVM